MKRVWAALSGLLALLSTPSIPLADESMEKQLIEEIYTGTRIETAMFDDAFLAAVPLSQIKAIATDLRDQLGPIETLEGEAGRYTLSTETHIVAVQIVLSDANRISGLLFEPPQRLTAGIDETLAALDALPGTVAYLVVRNGEETYARNADVVLDVGSAFKLGVLAAIDQQIKQGSLTWDQVVRLQQDDKSLPSGQLQDWPDGAPLTIHSAAAMMISQSDNTATDLLMRIAGREAVETALQISPVLTTREMFVLRADETLRARFQDGDDVYDHIAAAPLPEERDVLGIMPNLGWLMTAKQLCNSIEAVAALDVMQINPGVAKPEDWEQVAYKGGSIDGVLNLTHHLTAPNGDRLCVAITINRDAAVDANDVFGLVSRLISQLKSSA